MFHWELILATFYCRQIMTNPPVHQLADAAGFLTIYMNILCSLCYKFSEDYTLYFEGLF